MLDLSFLPLALAKEEAYTACPAGDGSYATFEMETLKIELEKKWLSSATLLFKLCAPALVLSPESLCRSFSGCRHRVPSSEADI